MTDNTGFLYGLAGDDVLWDGLDSLFESRVAGVFAPGEVLHVECWARRPARQLLPPSGLVLEWVAEWVAEYGEVDEEFCAELGEACRRPEVVSLVDAVLAVVGSRVGRGMADRVVASWDLVVAEHGLVTPPDHTGHEQP